MIAETNTEWDATHPAFQAGEPGQAWCEELHEGSPLLSEALLDGLQAVLSGAERRFTQEAGAAGAARRIVISEAAGRALIVEEVHMPAPETSQQSPKLETIGRMVSGVAHDFANLLTIIAGYGDLLLNRTGDQDPRREAINEIRKAAERGARLTSQLLGFGRGETIRPNPLDLNTLVTDVERMLRPILGEHLEISVELQPGLGLVVADPGQMEQVVMNLLLNARDAMTDRGRIRIETSSAILEAEEAGLLGMTAGPCVLLSVADSGHGIEPDAMERIFQPFYTTKERGEGTGLGLSIVLRVVKESGGAIRVRSAPGEGAIFTVYLPSSRHLPGLAANPAPRRTAAGSETVLLVEDEDAVRRLMAQVLQQNGYRVLEAADGEEALLLFGAHEPAIGLVLTDMVMPRMGGHELARRIRARRPGLPIICISGYTDEALHQTGALEPGMLFLQKPLLPDPLAAKVREALDSASRPFNPR